MDQTFANNRLTYDLPTIDERITRGRARVDAGDKPFIAFVVMMAPVMIVFLVFAPKILRELREWRRPDGLRKEDVATLKRISEMLDKMESRVDALEIILGESNPQKKSQTSRTQAYGNQR